MFVKTAFKSCLCFFVFLHMQLEIFRENKVYISAVKLSHRILILNYIVVVSLLLVKCFLNDLIIPSSC